MILQFNGKPISFGGSIIAMPSDEDVYPSKATFTPADLSIYADIEHKTRDRFKGLQDNDVNGNDTTDKLIYIIRHSERENTDEDITGKDGVPDGVKGGLTQKGYEYAEKAGKWFKDENSGKFSKDDCAFFCTSTPRTYQTVQAFAKGMFGLDHLPKSNEINVKDGGAAYKLDFDPEGNTFNYSWPACSVFADNGDIETLGVTAKQIIANVIGMMSDKKFALCVSHDFNTLPLASWACSQSLKWNFNGGSTDKWLCYLAGVVIAVKKNSSGDNMIYVKPLYTINDSHQGIMAQGYDNILR